MRKRKSLRLAVLLILVFGSFESGLAIGEECDGQYFAAEDNNYAYPLQYPAKELITTLKKAKLGISVEQRSLAVSYENGYLVSKCDEKAIYWYEKAAASGDEVAKKWISRFKAFKSLQEGPECVGANCIVQEPDENRIAFLYSDSNKHNHYFASVTINGHTELGVIDTGASHLSISNEMARKFGISLDEAAQGKATIANGQSITTNELIVPLVDVAGIKLRDVPVSVLNSGGPMLIGMSFLSRVNVTMASGTLTMTKRRQ